METRLASDLALRGHDVSLLSCSGAMTGFCSTRSARQRTLEQVIKKVDCLDCAFTSELSASRLNGPSITNEKMVDNLTSEDYKLAELIGEEAISSPNPWKFSWGKLPAGRIASYEVMLKYKLLHGSSEVEHLQDLKLAIQDVVLVSIWIGRVFANCSEPAALLVRNPNYSRHHVMAIEAQKFGLRVIYFDGSANISETYSHIMAWDWGKHGRINPALSKIEQTEEDHTGLDATSDRIERHFLALRKAKSHRVYSAKKSGSGRIKLLNDLGLDPHKKTILLALSSSDEYAALKHAFKLSDETFPGSVFKDQKEWVLETVRWASTRPSIQLVIRVHPREFSSNRGPYQSSMVKVWNEVLDQIDTRHNVDSAQRGISLYDLFDAVDVVVTGWSSAGLEAAYAGIPVVTFDKALVGYPSSVGLSGTSKLDYWSNLEAAISTKYPNVYGQRAAWKWLNLQMEVGTVYIGGRLGEKFRSGAPRWFTLMTEGLDRYLFFIYRPIDMIFGKLRKNETGKLESILSGSTQLNIDDSPRH